MSAPDSAATDPDTSVRSRSGVVHRVMARDLYELTKRVGNLEQDTPDPSPTFLASWLPTGIVLSMLIFVAGNFLYVSNRFESIETLQQQEVLAQHSGLESNRRMIDELQQTIRQQARSLRTMAASSASAAEEPGTPEVALDETNAVTKSASSPDPEARAPLPTSLEPREVLLIVASTLTKEEAIDQALALERDGHASEVVLGMTGYYGVALGRFDLKQAENTKSFMVESGVANTTPYMMMDESIDSYIYP